MKGSNRSGQPWKALATLVLGGVMACHAGDDDGAVPQAVSGGPNVFVIVLDAASSFYLGLYGDTHATTPNLDRLARESVVFDQAYSQSATTTPSTASLVTGVRVMTHRLNARSVLPEEFDTVAELFGEHGYTSYAFVGNPHAAAPPLGLHRGYDHLELVYESADVREKRPLEKSTRFRVVLPEDLERAIFEALPRFSNSDTYAYFHYLQPHKPYDAPARFGAGDDLASGECFCGDAPCRCGDVDWETIHEEFLRANETGYASPSTRSHLEALYRANLRYADEALAHLLDGLREKGLYEEALIVVMSDHGEAFFGHQRFGHNRTLYDDMVRIPLVMKFPARAKVLPRRIDALVETVDIIPTIFDFLDFEPSPQWEGESLWPLIVGQETRPGRPIRRWFWRPSAAIFRRFARRITSTSSARTAANGSTTWAPTPTS